MGLKSNKIRFKGFNILSAFFAITLLLACSGTTDDPVPFDDPIEVDEDDSNPNDNTPEYANIDFSHWKVTLPVDENNNGSPDEYKPSVLVNYGYQTIEAVKPFMYDDTTDVSIVFYTYPDVSTTNSSYSRTELRELINPSNSRENWTLLEGGIMTGKLKIEVVSENTESSDDYHKVIVMQIHGIISEEDMIVHGFSSNNGPPLIKIYWKDGYIWSHKKSLVDENTEGDDLLETSSSTWSDIKDNIGYVGFEPFNLKIVASDAKLEITLNDGESLIYQDVSLDKWPFENYYKAGNYLGSTHQDAFSKIKYYELTVTH